MTTFNQLICAPTINLFAFQQGQEFFAKSSPKFVSPEWSTHKYAQILNHFYVCQKIELDSGANSSNLANHRKSNSQFFTQAREFWGTIKTKEHLELIYGQAYPGFIDKNCLISLKLNKQKENINQAISVENLAYFNPKDCFSPRNINTNLGQTVVITALIDNKKNKRRESLQSLANGCVFSFANLLNSSQKAIVIDSSLIANGYFSTYYLPGASGNYNQIMVCLFFSEADQDNFQKQRQQLTQFLLSLHKLTYVHQHSKNLLKLACYQLNQLKYHLDISDTHHLTQTSLAGNLQTKYAPVDDRNIINKQSWQESHLSKTTKIPVTVVN